MSGAEQIKLRAWRRSDISSLIHYANNRKIWLNLRDIFPHPYTQAGAEKWIAICESNQGPTTYFAIELDGEAIGGVGCRLMDDVHSKTAEIGYWLGEPFWGRGIATGRSSRPPITLFRLSLWNGSRQQSSNGILPRRVYWRKPAICSRGGCSAAFSRTDA